MELYILDIDENEEDITSVFAVGLVTQPAIERNWMAFAKYQFAGEKISFDYDGTLSTDKGKAKAKEYIAKGDTVYIISARDTKDGMLSTATELGINESNVYATGSNENKIAKIKELNITKHFDNNQDVVNGLGVVGEKFVEPKEGESKDDYMVRCIPILINEGKDNDQAVAVCSSMYDSKFSKFAAIDNEKMILAGPLMAADQPIYRKDGAHEYYVSFPAKSIEKIVTKYGRSGKTLSFNINHNDSAPVKGAFLQQHFIIDSTKGINTPEGFEKLPDGSWFGFVKVDDREFWDSQIKTGNLKGFSVEGYFNDIKLLDAEQTQYEELKNKLLQCLN